MIRINRKSGWVDRVRSYKVIVDGQVIGDIRNGQSRDFDLAPGHHTLMLKIDWCRSPILEFDTDGRGTVEFDCSTNLHGFAILFTLFYVLFMRNNYIRLWQSQTSPVQA